MELKDSLIAMQDTSRFLGRTTNAQPTALSTIIDLNKDLQRRLKRLRCTAFPYFLDTISPISGLQLLLYLNDKSLQYRDLEAFIILENADEESECFNQADIVFRPFLRRRASNARPALVLIRFLNPCLFFRFLFVYFIVTFILSPFLNYFSPEI